MHLVYNCIIKKYDKKRISATTADMYMYEVHAKQATSTLK